MSNNSKILRRLLFCLLLSLGVHAGVVIFEWPSTQVRDDAVLNLLEVSLVTAPAIDQGTVADGTSPEPAANAPVRPAVAVPSPDPRRPPEKMRIKPQRVLPEPPSPAEVSQQVSTRPAVTKASSGSQHPLATPVSMPKPPLTKQSSPVNRPAVDKSPMRKPSAFPSVDLICKAIRQQEKAKSSPVNSESYASVSAASAQSVQSTDATASTAASAAEMTDAEPRYRSNPLPEYPYLARQRHWEGLVWLLVTVSAEGWVDDLQVAESSGFGVLDKSAMKTVRRWRFSPAKRAGLPVKSMVKVPVRFRLEE